MRLFHITPRDNLVSIRQEGIALSYCRTVIQGIWLCSAVRSTMLQSHVAVRHLCPCERLVTIPVYVPRSWLKRWAKGIWVCKRDVPLDRLGKPLFNLPTERTDLR